MKRDSGITKYRRLTLFLVLAASAALFALCAGCTSEGKRAKPVNVSTELETVRVYIDLGQLQKASEELARVEYDHPNHPEVIRLRRYISAQLQPKTPQDTSLLAKAAQTLKSNPRDKNAKAALLKGGVSSYKYLEILLFDIEEDVRIAAVRILAQNPERDAARLFLSVLLDDSADVVFIAHQGLCRLTSQAVELILNPDGSPDGTSMVKIWNRRLISEGLVAAATPTPIRTRIKPRVTPAPVKKTTPKRTPKPTPKRTVKKPATPKPTKKVSKPKFTVRPKPTPTPTRSKTPKPQRSKTPKTKRSKGPKKRPGVGGPQI